MCSKQNLSLPENPTPSTTLTASTNSPYASSNSGGYYTVVTRQNWIDEVGPIKALLLGILTSLSGKHGYSYMRGTSLASRLNIGLRSLERYLKELEDSKYIFRHSYSHGGGTTRHLITLDNVTVYWNRFLNREVVPLHARKKFWEFWFPGSSLPPPNNTSFSEPHAKLAYDGNANVASASKSINRVVKNNNTCARDSVANSSVQNAAAGMSETEGMRKKLTEAGFSGEQLEIGLSYWERDKAIINKKTSPMGWLVWAIKHGKAADCMKEENHKVAVKDAKDQLLLENQAAAKKLHSELMKKQRGFSITRDEFKIAFYFEQSKCGLPVGYADPDFTNKLKQAKEKAYASIRDSRKTNTLDAVGT